MCMCVHACVCMRVCFEWAYSKIHYSAHVCTDYIRTKYIRSELLYIDVSSHVFWGCVRLDVAGLLNAVALRARGAREVLFQEPARVKELKRSPLAPHPLQHKTHKRKAKGTGRVGRIRAQAEAGASGVNYWRETQINIIVTSCHTLVINESTNCVRTRYKAGKSER